MTEEDKTITQAGEVELNEEDLDAVSGGFDISWGKSGGISSTGTEATKPSSEVIKTLVEKDGSLKK